MLKRIPLLLSVPFLFALNFSIAANTRSLPAPLLVSPAAFASIETDRDRDGLQGPVRRVRTETSKLVSKGGKLTEASRIVLETATYDMKGMKIDNAYFLGAGGALTGKEVYKYDDKGNIVEMTLCNTDGSVLSKEKYDYEFDALGNWTKMTTAVAVIENGQMSFEPTEVTYRIIAYYLEDATAKRLQTAALSNTTNAAAAIAPASMNDNKAPAPAAVKTEAAVAVTLPKTPAAASTQLAANTAAPPVKRVSNPSALPVTSISSNAATPALALPVNVAVSTPSRNGGALVIKTGEELPPPPKLVTKSPVRPISGGVLNGKALVIPKPMYPETARRARVTGIVTVEVVVDVTGKVIAARAVSGPEMLRESAGRAARLARFTPALLSGQPVKISGVINYNFSF